jgi:hypothetical protein
MKKPFLLRLDPEVFDAIQRWANDDLRSVNAQIDFVLRRALKDVGRTPRRRVAEDDRSSNPADAAGEL